MKKDKDVAICFQQSYDSDSLQNLATSLSFFIVLDFLSYDVAFGSEITPCNKIDKPLVVYRFTGNVMTSITTLRT